MSVLRKDIYDNKYFTVPNHLSMPFAMIYTFDDLFLNYLPLKSHFLLKGFIINLSFFIEKIHNSNSLKIKENYNNVHTYAHLKHAWQDV